MEFEARMPTLVEWKRLVEITGGGDDEKMHWPEMYSWCEDVDKHNPAPLVIWGYFSPLHEINCSPMVSHSRVGFRPVFAPLDPDPAENGTVVPITTLYLNGRPTRVPTNPMENGNIQKFQTGSRFEFGDMLDIPAFQIQAIKVDGVYIADRNLLCDISWNDLKAQGF